MVKSPGCELFAKFAGDIILFREAIMSQQITFDDALKAVEKLDAEGQNIKGRLNN